jgi:CRISPR-associated protein Cas2
MPARRRYLSCYDIREPKRLRRIHKLMKTYGYALQYSIFVCDLEGMERIRMVSEARTIMNLDVDSLVVIDLGAVGLDRFEFIGSQDLRPPDSGAIIV